MSEHQFADAPVSLDADRAELERFDKLERFPYARRIAARISTSGVGASTVYGLSGPWGSGKSSVMSMIKTELEDLAGSDGGKLWAVRSFTPWSVDDTESLTEEFYSAVAAAMPESENGRRAAALIKSTMPVAGAVAKAALGALIDKVVGPDAAQKMAESGASAVADQLGNFEIRADSFEQRFKKMSAAIAEAGVNVLIIVDDVDRLNASELLLVLKSVRLLGRFDRVHYLLAYDEGTILDVLKSTDLAGGDRRRARNYMEKIVQYPFVLPPIQWDHLEREFQAGVDRVAANHGIEPYVDLGPQPVRTAHAASVVLDYIARPDKLTLRSIFRICSQVDVMLTLVGSDEIDLTDAILLTVLRLLHPEVYGQLQFWRSALLDIGIPDYGLAPSSSREDWEARFASVTDQKEKTEDLDELILLISAMFPAMSALKGAAGSSRVTGRRRISDPLYFSRYFDFRIPVRDIPDTQVRSEFEYLLQAGTWPAASEVVAAINDRNRATLIRAKVESVLDAAVGVEADKCLNAAVVITNEIRATTGQSDIFATGWERCVFYLVGRAVSSASEDEFESLIERYKVECGLTNAFDVIVVGVARWGESDIKRLGLFEGINFDLVEDRSQNLRESAIISAEQKLSAPWSADPAAEGTTILHLAYWLYESEWELLRERAGRKISAGECSLQDVASHFVARGAFDGVQFHHEYFERLVPREVWRPEDFPFDPEREPVEGGELTQASALWWASKRVSDILAIGADG